jgi:hypothetical protein
MAVQSRWSTAASSERRVRRPGSRRIAARPRRNPIMDWQVPHGVADILLMPAINPLHQPIWARCPSNSGSL